MIPLWSYTEYGMPCRIKACLVGDPENFSPGLAPENRVIGLEGTAQLHNIIQNALYPKKSPSPCSSKPTIFIYSEIMSLCDPCIWFRSRYINVDLPRHLLPFNRSPLWLLYLNACYLWMSRLSMSSLLLLFWHVWKHGHSGERDPHPGLVIPPGQRGFQSSGTFSICQVKMSGKRHDNGESSTVSWSYQEPFSDLAHTVFPGDLVSVNNFGSRYVFINSYKAAFDLFEKQGNIFSHRPSTTMLRL